MACGLFITDQPVRARDPTCKWDESSMTSVKNVLLFEIVPEESSSRSFLAYGRLLRSRSQARGLLPSGAPEAHPIERRVTAWRRALCELKNIDYLKRFQRKIHIPKFFSLWSAAA